MQNFSELIYIKCRENVKILKNKNSDIMFELTLTARNLMFERWPIVTYLFKDISKQIAKNHQVTVTRLNCYMCLAFSPQLLFLLNIWDISVCFVSSKKG